MKLLRFFLFISAFLPSSALMFGQQKSIQIKHAQTSFKNEVKYPGAIILNGDVRVLHEGIELNCSRALLYQKENILHAYGDVKMNQGDTISQTCDYATYNGKLKKAISWGNVKIIDTKMTLESDTVHFDRNKQEFYYPFKGKISNGNDVLTSDKGTYYVENKKFNAQYNVVVTSEESTMKTQSLDYFTDSQLIYFYGDTTIKTKEGMIKAKRGKHNSKSNISELTKAAQMFFDQREISADSIYYNRNSGFSSSTGNMILKDTLNKIIVKGMYAEYYKEKDSAFVVDKAVAINTIDKDSIYIHADTLRLTGSSKKRVIKAFNNVRIFKSDLQGVCDSLVFNQESQITDLYKKPVLWLNQNQITAKHIKLIGDSISNKLDSIKILEEAFIVQKEQDGFNQISGKNMFGKFQDNKLKYLLTKGNGEVVNYARNEAQELIGILRMDSSNILFKLEDQKISEIRFLKKPEGKTYPKEDYPEEEKKLKNFVWHPHWRPQNKDAIFTHPNREAEISDGYKK